MEIIFDVSIGILEVKNDSDQTYAIKASSGNGACLNKATETCFKSKGVGAIPLGIYHLSSSDASDPGSVHDYIRNKLGDWGDWRIPLTPDSSTNTEGRNGLYLHGGSKVGSAGCIDAGGGVYGNSSTDRLFSDIKKASGFVVLRVIK